MVGLRSHSKKCASTTVLAALWLGITNFGTCAKFETTSLSASSDATGYYPERQPQGLNQREAQTPMQLEQLNTVTLPCPSAATPTQDAGEGFAGSFEIFAGTTMNGEAAALASENGREWDASADTSAGQLYVLCNGQLTALPLPAQTPDASAVATDATETVTRPYESLIDRPGTGGNAPPPIVSGIHGDIRGIRVQRSVVQRYLGKEKSNLVAIEQPVETSQTSSNDQQEEMLFVATKNGFVWLEIERGYMTIIGNMTLPSGALKLVPTASENFVYLVQEERICRISLAAIANLAANDNLARQSQQNFQQAILNNADCVRADFGGLQSAEQLVFSDESQLFLTTEQTVHRVNFETSTVTQLTLAPSESDNNHIIDAQFVFDTNGEQYLAVATDDMLTLLNSNNPDKLETISRFNFAPDTNAGTTNRAFRIEAAPKPESQLANLYPQKKAPRRYYALMLVTSNGVQYYNIENGKLQLTGEEPISRLPAANEATSSSFLQGPEFNNGQQNQLEAKPEPETQTRSHPQQLRAQQAAPQLAELVESEPAVPLFRPSDAFVIDENGFLYQANAEKLTVTPLFPNTPTQSSGNVLSNDELERQKRMSGDTLPVEQIIQWEPTQPKETVLDTKLLAVDHFVYLAHQIYDPETGNTEARVQTLQLRPVNNEQTPQIAQSQSHQILIGVGFAAAAFVAVIAIVAIKMKRRTQSTVQKNKNGAPFSVPV